MKKSFYTVGLVIIAVLAAISFVLAPAMLGEGQRNELPAFGSYDGKQIRYEQGSDFANYVQNYARLLELQGQQINTQNYLYIFTMAFNSVVQKLAYTSEVEKSGWQAPQQAVNRAMIPNFTDENGNYSQRLYRDTPTSEIERMQREYREAITADRFSNDVFGSQDSFGDEKLYGVKSSENEVAFLQSFGRNERAFNIAAFNMNDYPDSEKAAYGNANVQRFVKYDMSVISCERRADAETAARRITGNEITFDDALSEYSNKTYSGDDGKLSASYQYGYQLERAFANADDLTNVASLEVGATSGVIEMNNGFAIFRIDGEAEQPDFENADTLAAVFSYLNTYETGHIEDYYMGVAQNFATAAALRGFDAACEEFGVEKTELAAFPLNYGSTSIANSVDTSVTALSGAATNERFLQTAFSLAQNEISSPIVNGRNVLVLQFTEEVVNDNEGDTSSVKNQIASYDQDSASAKLMASPKLQNDVVTVFLNYFLSSGN